MMGQDSYSGLLSALNNRLIVSFLILSKIRVHNIIIMYDRYYIGCRILIAGNFAEPEIVLSVDLPIALSVFPGENTGIRRNRRDRNIAKLYIDRIHKNTLLFLNLRGRLQIDCLRLGNWCIHHIRINDNAGAAKYK